MQRPGGQCTATVRTGTARAAEQNKTENVLMGQRMAGCDNGRLKLPKTPRQLLRCTIFSRPTRAWSKSGVNSIKRSQCLSKLRAERAPARGGGALAHSNFDWFPMLSQSNHLTVFSVCRNEGGQQAPHCLSDNLRWPRHSLLTGWFREVVVRAVYHLCLFHICSFRSFCFACKTFAGLSAG